MAVATLDFKSESFWRYHIGLLLRYSYADKAETQLKSCELDFSLTDVDSDEGSTAQVSMSELFNIFILFSL